MSEQQPEWDEGSPERLYVITRGRRASFDLVDLVVSQHDPEPGMHPEHAAILRLCANPLSVAEISAYLSLPASTITVLVGDLVDAGHVDIKTTELATARPDRALLETVMDGLRAI
jgi:hypothetical protein